MIDKNRFHVLNYIKKEDYTGSMEGIRYLLRKKTEETGTMLEAVIWPEPFNYIKTPDHKKQRKQFSFNQEGLEDAVEWMNEQIEQQKT